MQASLTDVPRPLLEMEERRSREGVTLFRLVAVIAVGAAVLFATGRVLISTGPVNEFSGVPAEAGTLAAVD